MSHIIYHNDYTKIVDDIIWINNYIQIRLSTPLLNVDQTNNKSNFHKEFRTTNGSYTINRKIAPSIILKSFLSKTNVLDISLNARNLYNFNKVLKIALNWCKTNKHTSSTNYFSANTKIDYGDTVTISSTYIQDENGNSILALHIVSSKTNKFTNMILEDVEFYLDFMATFNIYIAAANQLAYINRPIYGTNIVDISSNTTSSNDKGIEFDPRVIPSGPAKDTSTNILLKYKNQEQQLTSLGKPYNPKQENVVAQNNLLKDMMSETSTFSQEENKNTLQSIFSKPASAAYIIESNIRRTEKVVMCRIVN